MKNFYYLLIGILLLGCDYYQSSNYVIENKLNHPIVLKTSSGFNDNGLFFNDTIHRINPGDKLNFIQDRGNCGRSFTPPDYYDSNDTIPPASKFEIYIKDKLMDTLKTRSFWDFSSRKRVGIYKLDLTPGLLEEL
jgi:hypothetical protein